MKILSIGGVQLLAGFREAGHTVRAFIRSADCSHPDDVPCDFYSDPAESRSRIAGAINEFNPEVLFQGDHSGPLIHVGLEMFSLPKLWYAVDAHLHEWYRHYAPVFDTVFCAQQNRVGELSSFHTDVRWLPLYCSREVEPLGWEDRDLNVSFVGKIDSRFNAGRERLFSELDSLGIRVHTATGDWAPVYRRSKVVINDAVQDDLNLRFFEAPGAGALLITDELSHSIAEILVPGEDCLIYRHGDAASCAEQVRWALSHEQEAAAIAVRAHRKITGAHLERHRAAVVLERMRELAGNGSAASGLTCAHLGRAADMIAQLDLPEKLAVYFRMFACECADRAMALGDDSIYRLVVTAAGAVEREAYCEAAGTLDRCSTFAGDVPLEKRIVHLRLLAEAGSGQVQRARRTAEAAAEKFHDDPEIAAALRYFSTLR